MPWAMPLTSLSLTNWVPHFWPSSSDVTLHVTSCSGWPCRPPSCSLMNDSAAFAPSVASGSDTAPPSWLIHPILTGVCAVSALPAFPPMNVVPQLTLSALMLSLLATLADLPAAVVADELVLLELLLPQAARPMAAAVPMASHRTALLERRIMRSLPRVSRHRLRCLGKRSVTQCHSSEHSAERMAAVLPATPSPSSVGTESSVS